MKFTYEHLHAQEQELQEKENIRAYSPDSSYIKKMKQFKESYEKIIRKLPSKLANIIEKENVQRGYTDPIMQDILYSPTVIKESPCPQRHEKTTLVNYFSFSQGTLKDPMTNEQLNHISLSSDDALKENIHAHKKNLEIWSEKNSQINKLPDEKPFIQEVYPSNYSA